MGTSRRQFLQTSAVAAASATTGADLTRPTAAPDQSPSASALKLLILGGTSFLGPALVEAALRNGHTVTLFNRGRTNPHLFPEVEKLIGDRDPSIGSGLTALEGQSWDAVIDTSGYLEREARDAAEALAGTVDRYLFISTLSVYGAQIPLGVHEDSPVKFVSDEVVAAAKTRQDIGANYGAFKARCEKVIRDAFPKRATVVRPGMIVGPRDTTDRFTYWPVRVRQGGEVLAPGAPDDPVQYIDARDLAAFCLRCIEQQIVGVYNTTGPVYPTNIAELLYGCKAVCGERSQFTWVDADFLAEHQVAPWTEMTMWIPPRDGYEGFNRVNCGLAIDAGLTTRALAGTISDTLSWWDALPAERRAALSATAAYPSVDRPRGPGSRRAGISASRERRVLTAWRNERR